MIGKPWGVLTSDERLSHCMTLRCSKDHEHRVLEGTALVARSAYYRGPMVRRIANGFHKDLVGSTA